MLDRLRFPQIVWSCESRTVASGQRCPGDGSLSIRCAIDLRLVDDVVTRRP